MADWKRRDEFNNPIIDMDGYIDDKSAIPAHMPWMTDYSQPWDNKRFCEYFNITGYISETEAEPNSEWEMILNLISDIL